MILFFFRLLSLLHYFFSSFIQGIKQVEIWIVFPHFDHVLGRTSPRGLFAFLISLIRDKRLIPGTRGRGKRCRGFILPGFGRVVDLTGRVGILTGRVVRGIPEARRPIGSGIRRVGRAIRISIESTRATSLELVDRGIGRGTGFFITGVLTGRGQAFGSGEIVG